MTEENHEKPPVRLVGTGIRTRDLPNASLVHYHGATSLGKNAFIRYKSFFFAISGLQYGRAYLKSRDRIW